MMNRPLCKAMGLGLVLLLAGLALAPAAFAQEGQSKIEVKTLNDLPVHTYPVQTSVSDLLTSDEQFAALATQLRADIDSDLQKYDIQDAATLQDMYSTLMVMDMLDGDYEGVLKNRERVMELEDKEASRLMTGLVALSVLEARKEADPEVDFAAYGAAFARIYGERIMDLPWDVVQDRIQSNKGMTEIISENFLLGIVQSQIEPTVAKTGELSTDLARQVVRFRAAMAFNIPLREQLIAVYEQKIARHNVEKENIWLARDVTLDAAQDRAPVLVGIWDSGVDCSVFADIMFTNPGEKLDGKDNDGNGFVDDLHGIAFDLNGKYSTELLYPLGEASDRIDEAMQYTKGFMDVQSGIDSPEASQLKGHLGSLQPEQIKGFLEDLGLCTLYMHGTHVAGIAAAGNPFARLLGARIEFDYHSVPQPLTVEIAKQHAESYGKTARYFRDHGVRVVNMSWGWTYREIETGLEANGIGETAEARAELARRILDILKEGLYGAIEGTPEILYVCAAGNEDSDVEFDVFIPANFELPNLLVVGAVDQAGDRTGFTSVGKNVVVYSNGFEVESYVPGGDRMQASGTSMASPNVTNLAAKLLALKPGLGPTETIQLIKQGADALADQPDLLLINPKATVALLQNP